MFRFICISCICMFMIGCADTSTRHPRFEVSFSVGVTQKINEELSINEGIEIKTGRSQDGGQDITLNKGN